ncbi:ubiquinone biosynthesis protein UbiE [Streptomyces sp. F-3]|nr:ubiquinone biosynthesis protein UbiE [Streptomyces sp. F-3]
MTAPTAAQEAFLRVFHAERPAVTAHAFADGRAPDGRSGHEILRDRVAGARRVLDPGCGDGVLLDLLARTGGRRPAGVDLSCEALALARRRPRLRAAALAEARAQQLPFAAGTFDACVCHMALMPMGDVDRVAAETARVLSPGGVLACAIGGGALGGRRTSCSGACCGPPSSGRPPSSASRRSGTAGPAHVRDSRRSWYRPVSVPRSRRRCRSIRAARRTGSGPPCPGSTTPARSPRTPSAVCGRRSWRRRPGPQDRTDGFRAASGSMW